MVLVSGPTNIPDPVGVETIHVETAREMLSACQTALPADGLICAAAVADFRTVGEAEQKIKKDKEGIPTLEMTENPDILATLSTPGDNRPGLVIGFAAETENVVEYATTKRQRKGCDWLIANDVSPETGIMGGDHNVVHLITQDGITDWPKMSKQDVANRLAQEIAAAFLRGDT